MRAASKLAVRPRNAANRPKCLTRSVMTMTGGAVAVLESLTVDGTMHNAFYQSSRKSLTTFALVSLFDHDWVTTPDSAAAHDRGINPNAGQSLSERRYVYPVVLRSSAQNTRVCG